MDARAGVRELAGAADIKPVELILEAAVPVPLPRLLYKCCLLYTSKADLDRRADGAVQICGVPAVRQHFKNKTGKRDVYKRQIWHSFMSCGTSIV